MGLASDGISFSQTSGKILKIPCKYIQGKSNSHPAVINAIKAKMAQSETNVMPVIVKFLGEDDYMGIANLAILQAARELGFSYVKGMIIDEEMLGQIEVENGSRVSVALREASKEEILDFFDYLKAFTPGFSRIQPEKVSGAILTYRKANSIRSVNFLTKLRCGIGKAKIPILKSLVTF